eukprot:2261834-Prymnesium_polylepis.1
MAASASTLLLSAVGIAISRRLSITPRQPRIPHSATRTFRWTTPPYGCNLDEGTALVPVGVIHFEALPFRARIDY